jgi:hypothetical protein
MSAAKFTKEKVGEVLEDLEMLIAFDSPEKYLDTLYEIYHTYIMSEHEKLPVDFKGHAERMYFLFQFLKTIEKKLNDKD